MPKSRTSKSRTLRSHKHPYPSNQSKPRTPQTRRIHNLFHLPNPTQPGKISTISTIHLRQNLAKIGYATSATILILALLWLADTCKGYDVHKINDDTYQIDVVITRADAETLQKKMKDSNINYWPLRDVRLPGGILATGVLTYAEVATFLESGESRTTIHTLWQTSAHTGTQVDTATDHMAVFITYSYQELIDALHAKETVYCNPYNIINLSAGRQDFCTLKASELEEYTRRMHKIGATTIIVPYHYQLSTGHRLQNTIPIF